MRSNPASGVSTNPNSHFKFKIDLHREFYSSRKINVYETNLSTLQGISLESRMDPRDNLISDADANVHRTSKPKQKRKIYEYETRGRKSERKYQLKRARAEAKAVVAKLRHELQQLMSDCENIDRVREKLNEMDISMRRLKDAHEKYHAELMDEYDIEESKEYYEYEEIKVAQLVDRIDN